MMIVLTPGSHFTDCTSYDAFHQNVIGSRTPFINTIFFVDCPVGAADYRRCAQVYAKHLL